MNAVAYGALPRWRSVSRRDPCPVCGRDHNCSFAPEGRGVVCARVPSAAPAKDGRWYHRLDGVAPAAVAPVAPIAQRTMASPTRRDRVYRALLGVLDLSAAHSAHLAGPTRRIADDRIARHGYRTLPGRGRAEACRRLLAALGADALAGVPGFYVADKGAGPYWSFAGAGGALVVPVEDAAGRVIGLRLRQEESGRSAYRWFSSTERPHGTAALTAVHVARPAVPPARDRIYVVEGEIKANVAADRLGAVVVSLPGYGVHPETCGLLGVLEDLVAELGDAAVVLAFDQDASPVTNGRVRAAELERAKDLIAEGYAVEIASWSVEQGKGLDDLLLAGHAPVLRPPAETLRREGRIVTLPPGRVAEAVRFAPRALLPLDQARAELRRLVEAARAAHAETGAGRRVVLANQPGVGKTTAVLASAADQIRSGTWPKKRRLAYLAATNDAVDQHLAPGGALHNVRDRVFRLRGRNDENCRQLDATRRAGARRQIPAMTVCADCAYAETAIDPATGETVVTGWCQDEGYLGQKRAMKRYPVVVATVAALVNGSDELADFDEIVLDDVGIEALLEPAELRLPDVAEWRERLEYLPAPDDEEGGAFDPDALARWRTRWLTFFRLIGHALADAGRADANLVPALRATAAAGAIDLDDLLDELDRYRPGKTGRYAFETGYLRDGRYEADGFEAFPVVLARRLLDEVLAERNVQDGARSALKIAADPEPVLRCTLVRENVRETLGGTPLVWWADATPSPLLDRLLPDAERVAVAVAEPTHVTQVHDRLFRARDLTDPQRGARLLALAEELIDAAVARHGARRPVVLCPKAVDPDEPDNFDTGDPLTGRPLRPLLRRRPGARYGHWHADERAVNAFQDADLLVLLGHPQPPLDHAQRLAEAIHRDDPTPATGPELDLRLYDHLTPAGAVKGRVCAVASDPLVRRVSEAHYAATIVQAIGRGRPVLRSAEAPLPVLILCGMPVEGLRVDELTTTSAYLGGLRDLVAGDAGALERRERRLAALDDGRTRHNAERSAAAAARVDAAIASMAAAGETITVRTVRAAAGGSTAVVAERLRAWRSGRSSLVGTWVVHGPERNMDNACRALPWRLDANWAGLRPEIDAVMAAPIDWTAVGRRQ